eukprot:6490845-Amphidinium_carterae.3
MGPMSSRVHTGPAYIATTRSKTRGCNLCVFRGWHAVPEQDVLIHPQRAGSATHRADLRAINAMGLRFAFDVLLTGLQPTCRPDRQAARLRCQTSDGLSGQWETLLPTWHACRHWPFWSSLH